MNGIVIGVGHDARGDDAAGPAVIRLVQHHLPPGWHAVTLRGEVTSLVESMHGADAVIIVDAVVSGAEPGTIHRLDAEQAARANLRGASSHGLGLGAALALAGTLGRLPRHVTVFGIEVAQVAVGARISEAVEAHLPVLAAMVLEEARSESRA